MTVRSAPRFTPDAARALGDRLRVDWRRVSLAEFRRGLHVELEHGRRDTRTDVTHDDPLLTAKIALAHLREDPQYYTRLRAVESGRRICLMPLAWWVERAFVWSRRQK
jgi:hypothetical protein